MTPSRKTTPFHHINGLHVVLSETIPFRIRVRVELEVGDGSARGYKNFDSEVHGKVRIATKMTYSGILTLDTNLHIDRLQFTVVHAHYGMHKRTRNGSEPSAAAHPHPPSCITSIFIYHRKGDDVGANNAVAFDELQAAQGSSNQGGVCPGIEAL